MLNKRSINQQWTRISREIKGLFYSAVSTNRLSAISAWEKFPTLENSKAQVRYAPKTKHEMELQLRTLCFFHKIIGVLVNALLYMQISLVPRHSK